MIGNVRRLKILSRSLFVLYLFVAIYFLFFSEAMGRTVASQGYRYNLVLFKEINRFLSNVGTLGLYAVVLNIAGNILVFIPFGLLVPVISIQKRGFLFVAFMAFGFSLLVEAVQLILKIGCFDVDDLLMNTIGGCIGYLIFLVYRKISYRRKTAG
ncbi:VanZ like family protein [Parasporobacterium paucivorans DSM 15970]|uniref:VanZ like family protein n=2 Tax=Parasporobacterium TaxID=115543 RepID=A0A1M6HIF2_9FIRM|nr:VanZ like family protein [Parasporobacterium paucivorans DSM 15970]